MELLVLIGVQGAIAWCLVIQKYDYETPKPGIYKTNMMVMRNWDYPPLQALFHYAEFGCPYQKTDVNQFGYVSNRSQQTAFQEYKRIKYGYHPPGFDVDSKRTEDTSLCSER